MPKFKILTPVAGWEGGIGEGATVTRFVNGEAALDVVDHTSASRLAYFRSAGYGIEALDGVEIADAIRRVVLTPEQEHDELTREKAELEKAAGLDDLRAEVEGMRKVAEPEAEPDTEVEPDQPSTVVGRPADTDSVGDWRAYGVLALGLTEDQAAGMTKAQLQRAPVKDGAR